VGWTGVVGVKANGRALGRLSMLAGATAGWEDRQSTGTGQGRRSSSKT
jgi:hypothetical protein